MRYRAPPITGLRVRNPSIDAAELQGKYIILDLLDFDLFRGPDHADQALWCFEMRDADRPSVRLGQELSLYLVEMRKADRQRDRLPPTLADWIILFEHWQEEALMATITDEAVLKARDKLGRLSADAETRRLAFVRERALLDEASLLKDAREEGREEGVTEGKTEGKAETLLRQLRRRFGAVPTWAEERIELASPQQLDAWLDGIFDADGVIGLIGPAGGPDRRSP